MELKLKKVVKSVEEEYDIGAHGWTSTRKVKKDFYGYVDSNDKWVIKPIFARAEEFSDGVAIVELYEDKDKEYLGSWPVMVIDKKGKILFKNYIDGKQVINIYNIVRNYTNGLAVATVRDRGCILIDKNGKKIGNTYCYYSEIDKIKVEELKDLLQLISTNGAKVMSWADEKLFLQEENVLQMEKMLGLFLDAVNTKFQSKPENNKTQFAEKQMQLFHQIKQQKYAELEKNRKESLVNTVTEQDIQF